MFRKFFDPQEGESKAESKFELGEEISLQDVFNSQADPHPNDVEEKVEEKTEEKPEEKPVVVEEKKEVVEEKVEAPTPQDWKEIIKKQDLKEVHSLLGIDEEALKLSKDLAQDEFVKKLVAYRQTNGNLTPFIEAATRDWDKVSQEQLIIDDLKKQYSALSSEKAEKLAKSDFNQRFTYKEDVSLSDEENQELAELTALRLESEGARIRNLRKTEQTQFLDSVKPVDRNAEIESVIAQRNAEAQKEVDEFKKSVDSDPFFAKLFAEKKLTFGDKENSFNQTVNPDTIKEQTLDTNKFFGLFWDNGKFNSAKWAKVAAYANDIDGIDNAKINHGRSLGTKQIVEGELENSKEKTDQSSKTPPKKSLAKAFADEGQQITLQEMIGG